MFRLLYNAPQGLRPALLKVRSSTHHHQIALSNSTQSSNTTSASIQRSSSPNVVSQAAFLSTSISHAQQSQQHQIKSQTHSDAADGASEKKFRKPHHRNYNNQGHRHNNNNNDGSGHKGGKAQSFVYSEKPRPSVLDTLSVSDLLTSIKKDPVLMEAMTEEYTNKLNHFAEQIQLGLKLKDSHIQSTRSSNVMTVVNDLSKILQDENFRLLIGTKDLSLYLNLLNNATFKNRLYKLRPANKQDSDQYSSDAMRDEVMLKDATLKMTEWVGQGEFNSILNFEAVKFLFYTMLQFKLEPEILQLWEAGVNEDGELCKIYLLHTILGLVLRLAYDSKKFNYEEILSIYDLNTQKTKKIQPELLACIGQVAVKEADYKRGLDSLESLLVSFEEDPKSRYNILSSLSSLHLAFIADCKDLTIAKHFFDKVVDGKLPYEIQLKIPYVQSLLENCYEEAETPEESMELIEDIWTKTLNHIVSTTAKRPLGARYSNLNNTFFGIFFKRYPELNDESYSKLKDLIKTYTEIKVVDEIFLNTIISNYNWGNKMVLEQLIEYYTIYNVERSPVSYRISLKCAKDIQEYSNQEIYAKWIESLKFLDSRGYNYIPIADWAAFRDCTILSPFEQERKQFYLHVADLYKNYMQDYKTCIRFCKHWQKQREHFRDIAKLSENGGPERFETDVVCEVPEFRNLKENINFNVFSREILARV